MTTLTVQKVLSNGQATIAEIRGTAARLGMNVNGKKKHELLNELAEHERATEALRVECARKGLPTDGDREVLCLRLNAADGDTVSENDRKAYRVSVCIALVMGLAGLAISLPHVSAEIARLMGCGLFFGWLMGIVIDGGFITMKIVDCLNGKFAFSDTQKRTIKAIMVTCLVVSACLNASQFLRHVSDDTALAQCLAVMFAVFISVFVFAMFYVGASMLVRMESKDKVKEDAKTEADPVERLESAARELRRLQEAGSKV